MQPKIRRDASSGVGPQYHHAPANIAAVIASTIGYCRLMCVRHVRQRPSSTV